MNNLNNNILDIINQISDNDNNYLITTNTCNQLSKLLNKDCIKLDVTNIYIPPIDHGLSNCDYIIAPYYELHKHPS
jgi:uncharacterized protein (UPF0276 family)